MYINTITYTRIRLGKQQLILVVIEIHKTDGRRYELQPHYIYNYLCTYYRTTYAHVHDSKTLSHRVTVSDAYATHIHVAEFQIGISLS